MEKGLGPWRVLASQIWDHPHDPTIYGFIDIDTTDIQEYIKEERERTGEKK
jgi:pyruvate dehydrogenase E2 component (dihydrolipoamide acetyltransferase)